jgi:phage tail tape-measure protein
MSERLRIVLELDDKGFVKGVVSNNKRLASLGKHVRDLDRTIGSAEKRTVSWGKKLRDVTVTLASLNYIIPNLTNVMFGWQRQILNSNAELEQSVAIMKNFSTATNEVNATLEANNFVDKIIRKAGEAPFSINALTDSMVKLRVSGIEKVNQGFDALVDSVAAFGGTDAQLKRASVAMQQMGSKGVISMEELRLFS